MKALLFALLGYYVASKPSCAYPVLTGWAGSFANASAHTESALQDLLSELILSLGLKICDLGHILL
jgi:hypothetical protein